MHNFKVWFLLACWPAWGSSIATAPITGATPNTAVFAASPTSLHTPFIATPNQFRDYSAGIPDPAVAPTVTCSGAGCAATSYGYVIEEYNGIGFTLPSPTRTIGTSCPVLSGACFNIITLPVVADTNVVCVIINTSTLRSSDQLACDGSTVDDTGPTGSLPYLVQAVPVQNLTAGVLLPGFLGISSPNGVELNSGTFGPNFGAGFAVILGGPQDNGQLGIVYDAAGTSLGSLYADRNGGFYLVNGGLTNPDGRNPFGAGGFWQNVDTATSAATYTLTDLGNGILKCDSAGGNVTINLPVAANFVHNPYGRMFIIHKFKAANRCDVKTTDGTLINGVAGATGLSLFTASSTLALYWDNVPGDGNTGMWASHTFDGGGTLITATNCSSSASPAACGGASAGSVTIAAAATTVQVNTTAVTALSQIQIQPTAATVVGTKLGVTCNGMATIANFQPVETARVAGTSFTFAIPGPVAVNPACFSYTVTN